MNHKIQKYKANKLSDEKWSINKIPHKSSYKIAVTIPCYAEYDYLFKTLDSINNQDAEILKNTLVSIVINNSNDEHQSVITNNNKTYKKLLESTFRFECVVIDAFTPTKTINKKYAGAGMARKICVDSILEYLNQDSLICFLDADTLVSKNYLSTIYESYIKQKWNAATVNFNHQNDEPKTIDLITIYENYLKDTALNIEKSGSPYCYVSLGSTIICTYNAYISVGGMNRKIASEDFYFLQELEKFCGVTQIKDILVYPSSRYMSRLYLGTSWRLEKSLKGELNLSSLYFSEKSYHILREWISLALESRKLDQKDMKDKITKIDKSLLKFLNDINFKNAWKSINNAPTNHHFIKQFHRWFDGLCVFKLLKFYTKS